jgi:PhnB protein
MKQDPAGNSKTFISLMLAVPDTPQRRPSPGSREGGREGRKIEDYEVPWGVHRQGGFNDPFGHHWLVGDRSPLKQFPGTS